MHIITQNPRELDEKLLWYIGFSIIVLPFLKFHLFQRLQPYRFSMMTTVQMKDDHNTHQFITNECNLSSMQTEYSFDLPKN